ncbi:MAG: N-6 DNA methylase [Parafilimonas sp.]
MLDSETRRRIDTARDILVGKVPDPKSQVEQITIALIYKFMDDMDKEAIDFGGKASFFTGEYEKYGWSKIFDPRLGGYEMLSLYGEAIEKLDQNPNIPQLFRDIFKNAYLPYRDPETLKLFLKTINEFTYDHSEKLGDAFEYLLSVLGSQGHAGQFRTPRHIIDFIVDILQPKKNETILDPACGTAGFLISSYKYILKENTNKTKGDLLTPNDRKRIMNQFTGYDISPDMVRLSLVNMYLHHFTSPKIYEYDTLTSEDRWGDYFDIIMANPPFMTPKGGIKPHKKFTMQANRSEVLFVDYIAEHINPTKGRAGVIVPEGIIFQSATAYKALRKLLVDKNYLYAVVSLPAGIFQPYSGVKTSILLMDKTIAKKTDKIFFVKIENDGFDLGAQRKAIDKNDLPKAMELLQQYKEALINNTSFAPFKRLNKNPKDLNIYSKQASAKHATPSESYSSGYASAINIQSLRDSQFLLVEKEKIKANGDYNLSIDRYRVSLNLAHTKYEMVKLEDLFNEIRNGRNVEQLDEKGKYKVTRIQTIADGTVNLDKTKWTNDEVEQEFFMNEGDILLSHINSVDHLGKSAIFKNNNGKVIHGINLIRFQPNKNKIIPEYAIRVFKSNEFIETAKSFAQKAVNQASIKTSDLKQIKIPLPPLSIQQEIANKIEGWQKIIDGAKQIIENYKPQIDINPDWEMVKLGEHITIDNGNVLTEFDDGNIACIKVSDMNLIENQIEITTSSHWVSSTERRLLPVGSIVFPKRGAAIATNKKRITAIPCLIDNNCMGLTVTSSRLNNKYLFYFFKGFDLLSISNSAGIALINNGDVSSIQIPFPPLSIQQQIVNQIEQEQQLINANKQLIQIFEQKIKDEINKLWQTDTKEYATEEEPLSLVTEA